MVVGHGQPCQTTMSKPKTSKPSFLETTPFRVAPLLLMGAHADVEVARRRLANLVRGVGRQAVLEGISHVSTILELLGCGGRPRTLKCCPDDGTVAIEGWGSLPSRVDEDDGVGAVGGFSCFDNGGHELFFRHEAMLRCPFQFYGGRRMELRG